MDETDFKECKHGDCSSHVVARGLCEMHYRRELRHGDANYRVKANHGKTLTPEFRVWWNMKQRCYNPSANKYPDYGQRGISVCDRWRTSFEDFLADMGERPSNKHSIDRINNEGDYEPGNCRWATCVEQNLNRRNNKSNRGVVTLIENIDSHATFAS